MLAEERMPIPPPTFRVRRVMLAGSVMLSLVLGVVVFVARSPQNYVCLQLANGFGGSAGAAEFDLVDLQSGVDAPDTRVGQSPFGMTAPDGQTSAALQLSKPG